MIDFQKGTQAVIFDLDGVIADSELLHQLSFRRLFAELQLESHGADNWHHFVGTSDRHVMVTLLAGREVGQSVDQLLDRKAAIFLDLVREREPLFPPIPALVTALASRYALAVASGSLRSAIAAVLELKDLRRYFRYTVSVQDVARGKPAPDLFLSAAEALGVPPLDCVVIEDSLAGVTGAHAAGMRVIGITNTSSVERLATADAVVQSFDEIHRLLLGLNDSTLRHSP